MAQPADAARRLFDDLLNIEVSIILKPGMTARKMPEPPHALLDVIGDYDTFLCVAGNLLNGTWLPSEADPVQVRPSVEPSDTKKPHPRTGWDGRLTTPLMVDSVDDVVSVETFDELRERAVEAEAVYRHAIGRGLIERDDKGVILKRIFRNCDQIKGILSREAVAAALGDGIGRDASPSSGVLPLASDELITLRKIWEVGTETVVMQSVAQLDGDIITRIQHGRESATDQAIHELHRQSLASALQHWKFLGETAALFMRSFFLR